MLREAYAGRFVYMPLGMAVVVFAEVIYLFTEVLRFPVPLPSCV